MTTDTTETLDQAAFDLVVTVHRLIRILRRAVPASTLSPTQLLVLSQLIGCGPMRIGELAMRVPCSQPTATTVVSTLESAGLVQRIKDTADGRAIKVNITEHGREVLIGLANDEAIHLAGLLADLSDADRDLVLAAAPVLAKLAEPNEI